MNTIIKNETTVVSPKELIESRENFANSYVQQKGWDRQNLTMDQILEIRSCKEWKNPFLLVS